MCVRVHSYVQKAIPPPNAYYPILNMGHTAKKGRIKNKRNNSTVVWLIPRPSAIHVCTFTASPKRVPAMQESLPRAIMLPYS